MTRCPFTTCKIYKLPHTFDLYNWKAFSSRRWSFNNNIMLSFLWNAKNSGCVQRWNHTSIGQFNLLFWALQHHAGSRFHENFFLKIHIQTVVYYQSLQFLDFGCNRWKLFWYRRVHSKSNSKWKIIWLCENAKNWIVWEGKNLPLAGSWMEQSVLENVMTSWPNMKCSCWFSKHS